MESLTTQAELAQYAATGIGRITTAKPYIEDIQTCLGSDSCPAKSLGIDHKDWSKMVKEASDRLVYCDPAAIVTKSFSPTEGGYKGLDDSTGIPEKALLVYDAVLATKDKDRDGDVVHPEGMILEQKMPLLWQHVWASPIGVMVKTLEQNADHVVNRYAIADTPLGRDAAALVSMGALRKSHGFLPVPGEFSPISMVKGADGNSQPSGFDIRKLNVFESSLVSVPAGAKAVVLRSYEKEFDAICRAVSEKKLETPMVKRWAESLYESRTKTFAGVTLEAQAIEPQRIAIDVNVVQPRRRKSAKPASKAFELSHEKMLSMAMPDDMPGSFEDIQSQLRKAAEKKVGDRYDGYVGIIATFPDTVVICKRTYSNGESKKECYRSSYTVTDGKAELTGEMKEIEISPSIVEKSLALWDKSAAKAVETPAPETVVEIESDPILSLFV